MILNIKTKNEAALRVLSFQLENTGFKVVRESETEITIPNIGRKSHNYIKKVAKRLSIDLTKKT